MKSLLVLIPTAGLLLSSTMATGSSLARTAAAAGISRSMSMGIRAPTYVPHGVTSGAIPTAKQRDLLALRAEAFKLQKTDGGKLTPEHNDYLWSKLKAIQSKWP